MARTVVVGKTPVVVVVAAAVVVVVAAAVAVPRVLVPGKTSNESDGGSGRARGSARVTGHTGTGGWWPPRLPSRPHRAPAPSCQFAASNPRACVHA